MKIRTTKRCEIQGRVYQKYATIELDDATAKKLIKDGMAENPAKKIPFLIQLEPKLEKRYEEDAVLLAAMIINDHWQQYFDQTNVILRLSDRVLSAQMAMTKDLCPWVMEVSTRDKTKLTKASRTAKKLWDAAMGELSSKLVDSYIPVGVIRDDKNKKVGERFLFD